MSDKDKQLPSFQSAIYDHDRDGFEVLVGKPARWLMALNLLLLLIIAAALAWAFVAKADVIVSANGSLKPKQDMRRVYPPVDGELHGIYVDVGAPIQEGDVIARISARGAVQAAREAQEARLKLAEVRSEFELFPQKRAVLEQKAEALRRQLETKERELERRTTAGLSQVTEAQRARLAEARAQLDQATRAEQAARLESEKFQRLAAAPDRGGVSRNQVRQKQNAFFDARANRRSAQARLATLEYEVNQAISQADTEFSLLQQEVAEIRVQHALAIQEVDEKAAQLEFRLRSAELAANAAERLSFDNFDEDNFLKIYAPVSGIVAEISSDQVGEQVQSRQPLISIAPEGADRIVEVAIAEKDRGFLQTGQAVKLKFNAFPYRNYGSVPGRLEYISPTATRADHNAPAAYTGRIALEQETISTAQGDMPLTYGMGAVAEMVVRERRVIDLAIDPLRGLSN